MKSLPSPFFVRMAQPFVKILDNKLTLVGQVPQGNPRVVSILGKARMGKSTFFNTVVSHLRKKSEAPFKAIYGDEHCTRGIDSYFLPDHNLLLLDSQGLDYEDASHDPHLLLLLYILSDVIIFNDTRRLENGALKLMEPVCTFTNYLDIETVIKPKLYFRIFDSDVRDAQKNLDKVLGSYQDQYQSIRNSIKHLFDADIRLLKTEPLDRPAKMMLENNMYKELLGESLGFKEAVEAILKAANSMTQKSALTQVPNILEQINSNEEISIEKLDVVKLQAENDIHKWIETMIPDSVYAAMEVDGTQKCFDDVVEPRKNQKKSILTAFTKRFRDVEENIRGPFYRSINAKMEAPIQRAIEDSKYKARIMYAGTLQIAQADRDFHAVNSFNNSFTTIPEDYWRGYLRQFYELQERIQNLYEPVRLEIDQWISDVLSTVNKTLEKIKAEEKNQAGAVQKLLDEEAGTIEEYLLEKIPSSITKQTVIQTNKEIMTALYKSKIDELVDTVAAMTPRHIVSFRLENKKMIPRVIVSDEIKYPVEYDLVKEFHTEFADSLQMYLDAHDTLVSKELTEKKKLFLYNKLFPCFMELPHTPHDGFRNGPHSWTTKLIQSNPEIVFVQDNIAAQALNQNSVYSIMTNETQIDTYLSLYEEVLQILVQKGYCKTEEAKDKIMMLDAVENRKKEVSPLQGENTLLRFADTKNRYDQLLQDLFKKRLVKEYCKQVTQKNFFPEPYDVTS